MVKYERRKKERKAIKHIKSPQYNRNVTLFSELWTHRKRPVSNENNIFSYSEKFM